MPFRFSRRFAVLLLFLPLVFTLSYPILFAQEALPLPHNTRVDISGTLRRWHRVTLTFEGPQTSEDAATNPFMDYRLNVTFTNGSKIYVVPGYYAADGNAAETSATSGNKWRVHFSPDEVGSWNYVASFRTGTNIAVSLDANAGAATDFDSESGSFQIEETDKANPDFRFKGRLEYVNAHHLRFADNGEYYLKHGANSPENFLAYVDFDGTYDTGGVIEDFLHAYAPHIDEWNEGDPTWKGDKGKGIIGALNYLNSQNINSVYFLTYTIGQDPTIDNPGDGMDTWMWISPNDADQDRYDVSKLEQWEIVFQHMDKIGIQLHVIQQEEENDESIGGSSSLNDIRKLYYRELVARFSHHLAVQWNLGEENDNTDPEREAFSAYIRALDPYDHPIAVHSGYNAVGGYYDGLVGLPNFEASSMQGDGIFYNEWTIEWRQNSAQAGRKWAMYGDEQGPAVLKNMSNVPQIIRESLWGNLMGGGAGAEWYYEFDGDFGDLQSEDWEVAEPLWQRGNHAISFFKSYIPYWETAPDNTLVSGSALALAKPGELYAVYLPIDETVNLTIPAGNYEVLWFDSVTGGALQTGSVTNISGPGSKSLGDSPAASNQDWAVLVRRTDSNSTPTPAATLPATIEPNVELLQNIGFETAGTINTTASNWDVKQLAGKSKRVCNKPDKTVAYSGDCAYRLSVGTISSIQQKTAAFGGGGDSLTYSVWVKAKGLTQPLELKVKVKYQEDSKAGITILIDDATFDYRSEVQTLTLAGSVKKAKVTFKNPVASGKYWIDEVSLKYSD